MAKEVARLVPIHETAAPFFQLPQSGAVTIGRRTNCTVVLSDGAVSGLHCVLQCQEGSPLTFRVEDKSTNGVFINEVPVVKGVKDAYALLGQGDILSLGKVVAENKGTSASVRPQFRLEVQPEGSLELMGQPSARSRDLRSENLSIEGTGPTVDGVTAATSLDNPPAKPPVISSGTSTAEGFAQNLLVQEQRSKAKITGELLLVRRRLDEERAAREAVDRELCKARGILEDERGKRTTAQDGLERLHAETEQLRHEHRQLQDLRKEHLALETQHEAVEVDLGALLQRATTLEAGREHLRMDWQRASSDEARVAVQLAEAQARLQQAQERIETSQKKHVEARNSAEVAQESVERWQRELSNERSKREQLEDQAALLRADADRALHGESSGKEALATVEARQAELRTQIHTWREEAGALRLRTKEAREKLETDSQQAEGVRGAGSRFVEALRAYADSWARGLAESSQIPASALGHPDRSTSIHKGLPASPAPHDSGAAVPMLVDTLAQAAVGGTSGAHSSPPLAPSAMVDDSLRPPVPLWEPAATDKSNLTASPVPEGTVASPLRSQPHGMASLMVGSQDSPPLPPARSPEKVIAEVPRLLHLDAASGEASSVQRLATASILTLVTPPPSKRSMQALSAGRKRLRAH